jgi:diguanylate cyclase (GGDEF)-like protein
MKKLQLLALICGGLGLVAGLAGMMDGRKALSLAAGVLALLGAVLGFLAGQQDAPAVAGPVASPLATAAASGALPMQPSEEQINHSISGLFNEKYFRATIDTRVLAAKRHLRPVSIALVTVSAGSDRAQTADMVKVSHAIRTTLRDSDIACHLDNGRFAFILEDTPEDGAVWTLERLRRCLSEVDVNMVQWAGISCYPAHAFNSAELLQKAEEALGTASEWPQARIEVANAS